MSIESARLAVQTLESVARGELSPTKALQDWSASDDADPLLANSWHDLSHFAADDDIRAKDPDYAKYQVAQLLNRAKEIRSKYGIA